MKVVMLRIRTVNSNDGVNNHSKKAYETVKPPSYPTKKFTTAYLHELRTELMS